MTALAPRAVHVTETAPRPTESERFLAEAAHELRAPATVLVGMTETLQRLWDTDELRVHGPEMLAAMARQGDRLRRLVGDLLASAHLDEGNVPINTTIVPVLPVIRWAIESSVGTDPDVTIECEPTLQADVDADRLEQILVNLLANALNHGRPPISVTAIPVAGTDRVQIAVRDHGKGVPPEHADHLFERFSPLATGTATSTGLGLFIAHRLACAMDGDLIYEQANPGSRFAVLLPGPRTVPARW